MTYSPKRRQWMGETLTKARLAILAAAALVVFGTAALAQSPAPGTPAASPLAFENPISNVPGKTVLAVVVNYAPGQKNPPHRHAPSAFITAYVLEGAIVSQVEGGPAKVYRSGESFTEEPGAHHQMSANASSTEPAKMLAIFVIDTGQRPLSLPDAVGK